MLLSRLSLICWLLYLFPLSYEKKLMMKACPFMCGIWERRQLSNHLACVSELHRQFSSALKLAIEKAIKGIQE